MNKSGAILASPIPLVNMAYCRATGCRSPAAPS